MFIKSIIASLGALYLLTGCVAAPIAVGAGLGAGAVMVSDDRRTQEQIVIDDRASKHIYSLLNNQDLTVKPNRIRHTVFNGVVLLIGQVPYDNNRALAHQIADSTPGVKNVFNELTVGTELGLSQISEDSLLSSKVRAKLATTNNFKSKHLTIMVEDGSVYLMGLLTQEEQRIATSVTREVSGVSRVVTIMETWGN